MSSSKLRKLKLNIEKPVTSAGCSDQKKVVQQTISQFFISNTNVQTKRKFEQNDDDGTSDPPAKKSQTSEEAPSCSSTMAGDEMVPTIKDDSNEGNKQLCTNTMEKLHSFSRQLSVGNATNIKESDTQDVQNKTSMSSNSVVHASTGFSSSQPSTSSQIVSESRNTNFICDNENKDRKSPFCKKENVTTSKTSSEKIKYTPLEQQFVEIRDSFPGVLLFVECGYKYRFFGKDAEIAAKELNIFCHPDHNFMTASIPTHRLLVHVSRLVSKGYKVGVVKQTETAALKAAGDNRSAPFTRKLTHVYTKATLIDGSIEPEDGETLNIGGHLMCVYEVPQSGNNSLQSLAILSVDLATGEVIYDTFSDNQSRFELETRLTHIQPVEVLMPRSVSAQSTSLVQKYSSTIENGVRTELLDDGLFVDKTATDCVRQSYQKMGASAECIKEIFNLQKPLLICLGALLSYLEDFNLSKVLKLNSSFTQFSSMDRHMHLCGRTLANLEVFVNSIDGRSEGSLYALLNHTCTMFGGRMLRHWLGHPLVDLSAIEERQDAVQEILEDSSLVRLRQLLKTLPDLERGLTLIFHGKCSPQEFLSVCQSLQRVYNSLITLNCKVSSPLLQKVLSDLPNCLSAVHLWVQALNVKAAKGSDKTELFTQESNYPKITSVKAKIQEILSELQAHRKEVRLRLKAPALEYTTLLGTEFLVEVKNTNLGLVPQEWVKMSATKTVTRFHTPFIVETYKRLSQQRESLVLACDEAWQVFLRSFEAEYPKYKQAVHSLATLDCLFALAQVAEQGYCRPKLVPDRGTLHIEQGRHPVVDVLLSQNSQQFVPNDTNLQPSGERCMIITGPNMGGKSSYIKQVGLICLMAQVGSFVPAESATLSVMDAVYTRMGASDDLYKGRSTFMVELCEASEVLAKATERSLVILDELGRGTSTHDGVAIAHATLTYFVEKVKCLTLFVTHYPTLVEVEQLHPSVVANYHMSFYVQDDSGDESDDVESLVFLYQLVSGVAHRSYGLNVARLAGIPKPVLSRASEQSRLLEDKVLARRNTEELFMKIMKEEIMNRDIENLLQCV